MELVLSDSIMTAKHIICSMILAAMVLMPAFAQNTVRDKDSLTVHADTLPHSSDESGTGYFPHRIPNMLPPDMFVPSDRLAGLTTWMGGPMARPVVHVMPVYGFSGYAYGRFTVDHWDKFFSNLLSYNQINVPQLIDSQVMMVGNTLSLGKKRRLFFTSGILYGRHYGTWGNMIGMGSREGLIYRPNGYLILTIWTQEYQSVYAYSPVLYATPGESTASIKLPASPVMVSYGAQAYFLAGQFWIGLGAILWQASRPEH